jgi:hypothetical protein
MKRFFRCDDGDGRAEWFVVADDLEHAQRLLRDLGSEFGPGGVPFDEAGLVWREMSVEQAASKTRCHREDGTPPIALSDAEVGEMFCSEW